MKLEHVETFIAVAETGSIGGAAARLGLTQPAVTRQIQQLEKLLGAPLLDRRSKPPTLTPQGQRALAHCRQLVKVVDELHGSVGKTAAPAGKFRLGVAFGATDLVLSEPIDALRQNFPQLKIEVVADWSAALMRHVQAGAIDAAVVLRAKGQRPLPELQAKEIGSDRIVVVASKSAPVSSPTHLSSLAEHDWVLNPKGCWYRDLLQEALMRKRAPLKVAIETFGLEYQLSLVARGVGLGLVPAWAIRRSAHRTRLKTVEVKDYSFELTVWTVRSGYWGRLLEVLEALERAITASLK